MTDREATIRLSAFKVWFDEVIMDSSAKTEILETLEYVIGRLEASENRLDN